MPITKQAIKRVRQDRVRTARNQHYKSNMKSMLKLILGYIQAGEVEKAKKILPKVVSAIDIADKKNIIHANNAARKKSRIDRALTAAGKAPKKAEKIEKEVKEEKAEKKPAKKAPKKSAAADKE